MREWADFTVQEAGGRTTIVLEGPLVVSSIGLLDRRLRDFREPVQFIDMTGAGAIDTVGAWTVARFADENGAHIHGASEQAEKLIETVRACASTADIEPPRRPLIEGALEDTGALTVDLGHGVVRMIGFLGAIIAALGMVIRHPRRFRMTSLVRQLELVGVTALPIVGLMSFLIGIVIAQQGAAQLRQFGAELGTMKLTEEIDAMRTIGVSPMEALVIPRILAAVLMMPLLGFFSAVMAVIGGAFIADLTLGIPFLTFLRRIQEVVPLFDLWVGLIKAPVFGLIVALAGCYQGMQVRGNSEEVGLRTTKAVVQAIFMVIVLDAFFAIFFDQIGWS